LNLSLLAPEIALATTAILVVVVDLFVSRKGWLTLASLAGILVAGGLNLDLQNHSPQMLAGLFAFDRLAIFFQLFFLGLAFLIILASRDYVARLSRLQGEFHALILLSSLGMMLLAGASNLIAIFVTLELTSVPIYALAGFLRDKRSSESALKYMLLSGVNSAVLLYGLTLVFGFTGKLQLAEVAQVVTAISPSQLWAQPGLLMGLALVVAGFGFKIAAVPFHMWAPDVYEGAPAPVTLLLSAGSKVAGFAVLLRFLGSTFLHPLSLSQDWGAVLAVLAAVGMTLGNLLAIPQTNLKRLLAYSGIAHSGYMLVALATLGYQGVANTNVQSGLLFYVLAFALAEICVFTAIIITSRKLETDAIASYAGLGKRSPWLAVGLTLGLISLTGLPPTAGFLAKFFVFSQATSGALLWLVIVAVLNTVISAFYYLRVVRVIWLNESATSSEAIIVSKAPALVLLLVSLGILLLGLVPGLGLKFAQFGASIIGG
jgi:NADH-quinone oxidoreductase subunit N